MRAGAVEPLTCLDVRPHVCQVLKLVRKDRPRALSRRAAPRDVDGMVGVHNGHRPQPLNLCACGREHGAGPTGKGAPPYVQISLKTPAPVRGAMRRSSDT
jgi:hypothetical protein